MMDRVFNREPGWLLEIIRDEWRKYVNDATPRQKRSIKFETAVELYDMTRPFGTGFVPFDAAGERKKIAATLARIEREFADVKR